MLSHVPKQQFSCGTITILIMLLLKKASGKLWRIGLFTNVFQFMHAPLPNYCYVYLLFDSPATCMQKAISKDGIHFANISCYVRQASGMLFSVKENFSSKSMHIISKQIFCMHLSSLYVLCIKKVPY